jgi:DNA-binding LacI/PurR family transcriptional regulator
VAAEMILDRILGREMEDKQVILPVRLVERESVRNLNA